MIYRDGYKVNERLRFVTCPRCGNEEYSDDAKHCKICGFSAYNECEGSTEYDNFGNVVDFNVHKNVGNARYCEYCGKPTYLFNEKLLKPYTEVEVVQEEEDFNFDETLPFM